MNQIKDKVPYKERLKKFKTQSVYTGYWKDGLKDGMDCQFYWDDGQAYDGEFQKGLMHGQGVLTKGDHKIYEGEWKEGLQHGKGTYIWENGNKYVGEWKEGKKHGEAEIFFDTGYSYKTQFENDL